MIANLRDAVGTALLLVAIRTMTEECWLTMFAKMQFWDAAYKRTEKR